MPGIALRFLFLLHYILTLFKGPIGMLGIEPRMATNVQVQIILFYIFLKRKTIKVMKMQEENNN